MKTVFFARMNAGLCFSHILPHSYAGVVRFGEEIFNEFKNMTAGNAKGVMYRKDLPISDAACTNVNNWDRQCIGNTFCRFNRHVSQH